MAISELGHKQKAVTAPAASTAPSAQGTAALPAEAPASGTPEHLAAVKAAVGHTQARIQASEAGMEQKLSTASSRQQCGKDFLGGGRRLVPSSEAPPHSDMMRGGGGGAKPPSPLPSPPQAPRLQPWKNPASQASEGLAEKIEQLGEKLGAKSAEGGACPAPVAGETQATEGSPTMRAGFRVPGKGPLPKPTMPGAPRHQNARGAV